HVALVRPQLPDQDLHQRRLAGAVRPEKPDDPLLDLEREIVDRDHLAVPSRDVARLDHAHPAITSTAASRLRRSAIEPATTIASIAAEAHTGNSRSVGSGASSNSARPSTCR